MTKSYDEIVAEREARKAAAAAAKKEQAHRELMVLNDLELEHGDDNVMGVHTVGGLVVIARPRSAPMQRWREIMWSEKTKAGDRAAVKARAAGDLAATCVLYPDKQAYSAMVEKYPGVADAVGAAAVKFAGIVEEEEAGKS
jgi:hypothetical protein